MPRTPEEPWLLPFLRALRIRPGAYLGAEDVSSLELFIAAYTMARSDLGLQEFGRGEETLLSDFQTWLEARFEMTDARGWHGLIARRDGSAKNVFTFLRLFDEFLASRGEPSLKRGPTGRGDAT